MTTQEEIKKVLVELGGKVWEKNGKNRVYFNQELILKAMGLKYTTYNTGNISSASLRGETISHAECGRILSNIDSAYYDFEDGLFHWKLDYYDEVKDFCAELRKTIS